MEFESAKPKIKLTHHQLTEIARIERGSERVRMRGALACIGRSGLVQLYIDARQASMDAIGLVKDIEMARYKWGLSADLVRPLDEPAHEAAKAARIVAEAAEAGVWARIQALVDRAKELLEAEKAAELGQVKETSPQPPAER